MTRVALFPNFGKPEALPYAARIADFMRQRGVGIVLSPEAQQRLGTGEALEPGRWAEMAEFCIVLGGDGTLLSAARSIAPGEIPLLGVNLGRLGFLTEVETGELFSTLDRVLAGDYTVEERSTLDTRVLRDGSVIGNFSVLNEVVVAKGPFARLIQVNIWVDGRYIDTFPGDGVIIATPTGSTAYSLSAGGPITSPGVRCTIITPIAPHTLYSRAMVIEDHCAVAISFAGAPEDMYLTVDGQAGVNLMGEDLIQVSKSTRVVRLVRRKGWDFFDVLRRKMKEGQSKTPERQQGIP